MQFMRPADPTGARKVLDQYAALEEKAFPIGRSLIFDLIGPGFNPNASRKARDYSKTMTGSWIARKSTLLPSERLGLAFLLWKGGAKSINTMRLVVYALVERDEVAPEDCVIEDGVDGYYLKCVWRSKPQAPFYKSCPVANSLFQEATSVGLEWSMEPIRTFHRRDAYRGPNNWEEGCIALNSLSLVNETMTCQLPEADRERYLKAAFGWKSSSPSFAPFDAALENMTAVPVIYEKVGSRISLDYEEIHQPSRLSRTYATYSSGRNYFEDTWAPALVPEENLKYSYPPCVGDLRRELGGMQKFEDAIFSIIRRNP